MAAYVIALISQTIALPTGEQVGMMTFCYKPYGGGYVGRRTAEQVNDQMDRMTVGKRRRAWSGKPLPKFWVYGPSVMRRPGQFKDGMEVYLMPHGGEVGFDISLYDDAPRTVVGTLRKRGRGKTAEWLIDPVKAAS